MNELPPLPEPLLRHVRWDGEHVPECDRYNMEQMQAYGQQCRDAALIEAAAWLDAKAHEPSNCIIGALADAAAKLRAKVKG